MALFPLPPLHIEHRSGAAEVVLVAGELDLCTAPYLAEELRRAQSTGADVIVDLEKVTFMDCAGLRVLLSASTNSGAAGFSVTPGPRQVRRLFELTDARVLLDVVAPGVPGIQVAAA
jgi:anti-sigma B factor antagonist